MRAVVALAFALAPFIPASAATIAVTTTADEAGAAGTGCSLREAITAANTNAAFGGCPAGSPGADIINLPAGTYTLNIPNAGANEDNNASGDLDILESVTIQGAGAASTIIQAGTNNANGIDKVFAVNPFCTTGVNVTISGVTVRFGRNTQPANSPDFSQTGAGIDWCAGTTGSFTLSNAIVSDNTNLHGYGGGLNFDSVTGSSSSLTISNVTFQNNTISNDATTNAGTGAGFNIFGYQVNVNITNSTFSGNQALRTNAGGGGIFFRPSANSSLTITGSTFTSNTAQGSGGGLMAMAFTSGTTVSITDTQVTNNTATASFGGGLNFGNAALNTTPFTLTNLLVTGNSAGTSGGGIYVGAALVTMTKSRIVGNAAPSGKGLLKNVDPGTATVSGNWWGCSTGPAAAPCDVAATLGGTLNFTPWLRANLTGTSSLVTNQTSALTASFLTDSSNAAVPVGNLTREIGLGVTWAAGAGTLSAQQTTVQAAGTATATYTATGPGTPVVSAKVDNDNTAPVSSNVLSLTIAKANTTAAVTSHSPAPSVVGQAVSIGASVAGQFGNTPTAPTGSITVSAGAQNCTITLPAGSCNISFTSPGAKSITATYNGDAAFNASAASAAVSHTVNKADTTTSITSDNPDPSLTGQSVAVAYSVAVVAPGAGTLTGNVTVSDGVDQCTASVAAGQCTLALSTAGARVLTASYAGDTNFNASVSTGAAHQVNEPVTFDIDGNGKYEATTDGLLILRYLLGVRGPALIVGAIGANAHRTTELGITQYLDYVNQALDVDANTQSDGMTDGVMIIRYLFGLRGAPVTANAIGGGATRSGGQIETYIQSRMP